MQHRLSLSSLLALGLVSVFGGCDAPGGGEAGEVITSPGADVAAEIASPTDAAVVAETALPACEFPTTQSLSSPCCPQHGIDACGANLFCAAFDGRAQATCYAERSRPDQSECTGDVQCTSGSCNGAVSRCRSVGLSTCRTDIGCAPTPNGQGYACAEASLTCQPLTGDDGGFCETAGDCDSGRCVGGRCSSGALGVVCVVRADCQSGFCMNGRCSDGHEGASCLSVADCTSGLLCAVGRCSDGGEDAPCAGPADCGSEARYCVEGACETGRSGSPCTSPAHCEPGLPLCVDGMCDDGANIGEACGATSDCAPEKSPMGVLQAVRCDSVKQVCVLAQGGKCTLLWDGRECETGKTCKPDEVHPGVCSEDDSPCSGNYCMACHGDYCSVSFVCYDGLACQ